MGALRIVYFVMATVRGVNVNHEAACFICKNIGGSGNRCAPPESVVSNTNSNIIILLFGKVEDKHHASLLQGGIDAPGYGQV